MNSAAAGTSRSSGYGQTRPAADEGGDDEQVEAARARNRRVEISTD